MELRNNVHGSQVKVPDIEHNYGSVYLRFNVQPYTETDPETGETFTGWVYDEWFMTEYEYQLVQQGTLPYGGTWDDALRSVEREYLYEGADRMCMKYMTYAKDDTKLAQWTAYKTNVHATILQETYPSKVTYPNTPE